MKDHKEMYPEQYAHPLCGKRVRISVKYGFVRGTVERVVPSRFGPLVILKERGGDYSWPLAQCREGD